MPSPRNNTASLGRRLRRLEPWAASLSPILRDARKSALLRMTVSPWRLEFFLSSWPDLFPHPRLLLGPRKKVVDARDKPGHDDLYEAAFFSTDTKNPSVPVRRGVISQPSGDFSAASANASALSQSTLAVCSGATSANSG
jgi:hypothetical protein